jgi:hypothetical protein
VSEQQQIDKDIIAQARQARQALEVTFDADWHEQRKCVAAWDRLSVGAFDAAMRRLDAAEAAERQLAVLRTALTDLLDAIGSPATREQEAALTEAAATYEAAKMSDEAHVLRTNSAAIRAVHDAAKETPSVARLEELDEKGWVFIGGDGLPYRCCIWDSDAWLFRWHPDRRWVSLKKLTQMDVWLLPHNLTEEQQELYYAANNHCPIP